MQKKIFYITGGLIVILISALAIFGNKNGVSMLTGDIRQMNLVPKDKTVILVLNKNGGDTDIIHGDRKATINLLYASRTEDPNYGLSTAAQIRVYFSAASALPGDYTEIITPNAFKEGEYFILDMKDGKKYALIFGKIINSYAAVAIADGEELAYGAALSRESVPKKLLAGPLSILTDRYSPLVLGGFFIDNPGITNDVFDGIQIVRERSHFINTKRGYQHTYHIMTKTSDTRNDLFEGESLRMTTSTSLPASYEVKIGTSGERLDITRK